jgi:addiction module HigA family antidote
MGHKITRAAEMKVKAGDVPQPGEWIRSNVLRPLGLTVSAAAKRIGTRRATLNDVVNGRAALSDDLAYRLEALSGVDADLMIGMQAAHDRAKGRETRARYAREIERVTAPA